MHGDIREGMTVMSSDGEKLGKVIRCDTDRFIIEKGFFFPKDYVVRYEDVSRVSGDEAYLSLGAASLREAGDDGWRSDESRAGTMGASDTERTSSGSTLGSSLDHGTSEEIRVPLAEEELVAEKHQREAGEVRVRKEVVTEHKQIEVPVTREEVHVERVPVQGGEARGAEARFEQDEIRVPVREEEVEIRKRPVVREEIRVSKTARREERRADADVRREEAKIEREGDLDERGGTVRDPEE